ncbi:hypothetical protein [Microbispora sp. GKU 823]|uniref:hypothetical protein n=1 Tax=Microbispora sp. GKU 823 TaxID=1652100 RepID=UPI001C4DE537|nr:hypothetical protein [Microbispora sp. GKU 823]
MNELSVLTSPSVKAISSMTEAGCEGSRIWARACSRQEAGVTTRIRSPRRDSSRR